MIAIGIDPHMKTHTAVALDSVTGASVVRAPPKLMASTRHSALREPCLAGPEHDVRLPGCIRRYPTGGLAA